MKNIVCTQCPRNCKIDRTYKSGFCGTKNKIIVSKIMKHFWEEPIISGNESTKKKGSGAIFFAGCNLRCAYCQNYEISHNATGTEFSPQELADKIKELENEGVTNINFVTPTHFTEQILKALEIYTPKIPLVWNSSGYENPSQILRILGKIKVFLYDFKYFSNTFAEKYSKCSNYFENCTKCLKLIKNKTKDTIIDGIMTEGLIIRHMVLPSHTEDSKRILDWINTNLGNKTYISIMSQYTPFGESNKFPEINRKLKPIEYKVVTKHAELLGFENGYFQELDSSSTSYIPEFKKDLIKK